jgi:hypothetical protein
MFRRRQSDSSELGFLPISYKDFLKAMELGNRKTQGERRRE